MSRFLIDENLPRMTAQALRDAGYEAQDVREIGLGGASDAQIYSYLQSHPAVTVTADKDFADITRFPSGTHHGIVILRVPDTLSPPQRDEILVNTLRDFEGESLAGALVIVAAGRVRVRRE